MVSSALVPGAGVNLEVDLIARYLDRMRAVDAAARAALGSADK